MRGFVTLALLVLAIHPLAAQTPDNEPRVRGCFSHSDPFCKKRCGNDEACFKECKLQCMTPGDGDSIRMQPKK